MAFRIDNGSFNCFTTVRPRPTSPERCGHATAFDRRRATFRPTDDRSRSLGSLNKRHNLAEKHLYYPPSSGSAPRRALPRPSRPSWERTPAPAASLSADFSSGVIDILSVTTPKRLNCTFFFPLGVGWLPSGWTGDFPECRPDVLRALDSSKVLASALQGTP